MKGVPVFGLGTPPLSFNCAAQHTPPALFPAGGLAYVHSGKARANWKLSEKATSFLLVKQSKLVLLGENPG